MTDAYLDELESSISQYKELREFGKAAERLMNNADFKTVVMEGYLRANAVRLVELRMAPGMQTPGQQDDILRQIDGIAAFKAWLRIQEGLEEQAQYMLEENEATRESILAEGLN